MLSSHHIITTANDDYEVFDERDSWFIKPNKKCELHMYSEEYGHSFDCIVSMWEKLPYCCASMMGYLYQPHYKTYYTRYTKSKTNQQLRNAHDRIINALIQFSNYGINRITGEIKYLRCGKYEYIDGNFLGSVPADSKNLVTEFLKKNNISLYEFLTNKKYKIIINNKHGSKFKHLIEIGLIDESKIVSDFHVKTKRRFRR